MRKVVLSMMVSADGYIEAPNDNITWHVWDDEMSEYMMGFFDTVDTFIYGRKSFELMIEYWPSQTGEFADIMNETPKLVFSRNLENVEWNSKLIKENVADEIRQQKNQPGKNMVLFAGANIASTFIEHDFIDEYRLIVNPVVLGAGTPLFKEIKNQLKLKLLQAKPFQCGNTLLCYEPVSA
jgi:dihydrofolate reductase